MSGPHRFACGALVFALALPAFAQGKAEAPQDGAGVPISPFKPGAYKLENGVFIYPTLTTGLGYDSNYGLRATGARGTAFLELNPSVIGELVTDGDVYALGYRGEITHQFVSDGDNTDNHLLQLSANNVFSSRVRLNTEIDLAQRYDPRGTTDRNLGAEDPDQYRLFSAGTKFAYGATGATGRVEADAAVSTKTYLNNRDRTATGDLNALTTAGRFLYRIGPKTQLLGELRLGRYDYRNSASLDDNTEFGLLGGATWEGAAATTGTVKAGYLRKSYSRADVDDFGGLGWEAKVTWLPRSYSQLELSSGRQASDSTGAIANGTPDYLIVATQSARWTHNWSSYTRSILGAQLQRASYVGVFRKDTYGELQAEYQYDVSRRLQLGAEVGYARRKSSEAAVEYTRANVLFKVAITL